MVLSRSSDALGPGRRDRIGGDHPNLSATGGELALRGYQSPARSRFPCSLAIAAWFMMFRAIDEVCCCDRAR